MCSLDAYHVATGPVDSNEMLQRAIDLLSSDRQNIGAVLTVVVTGGPLQSVLRPAELEDKELSQRLHKEALFGQVPVLDAKQGTDTLIVGDSTSLDLVILLTIRAYQVSRNNQQFLSVRPKSEVHDTIKNGESGLWLIDELYKTVFTEGETVDLEVLVNPSI